MGFKNLWYLFKQLNDFNITSIKTIQMCLFLGHKNGTIFIWKQSANYIYAENWTKKFLIVFKLFSSVKFLKKNSYFKILKKYLIFEQEK